MARHILCLCLLGSLAITGCSKFEPILTPQEFAADCRHNAAGAEAACAAKVCEVYQAVVTDYYEDMDGCYAACKERAAALETGANGACLAKIKATRERCMEFCNRKFYRCNCAK